MKDVKEATERAMRLAGELSDESTEAYALRLLGRLEQNRGQFTEAIKLLCRCIELSQKIGRVPFMAQTLAMLGDIHAAAGDTTAAHRTWEEAAQLFDQLGTPGQTRREPGRSGAVDPLFGAVGEDLTLPDR
jgi:uncharacterized protein HemY